MRAPRVAGGEEQLAGSERDGALGPPAQRTRLEHDVAQDVEHVVRRHVDDQLASRQLAQVQHVVHEHAAAEQRALQHRQVHAGRVVRRQVPVVLEAPQRAVDAVQRIAQLRAAGGGDGDGECAFRCALARRRTSCIT